MSTYRYNKEDNTISPVVPLPPILYLTSKDRDLACKTYEAAQSTRIPVSGNHKWNDGYFVTEGVHFKIEEPFNNGYPTDDRIAIPIEVKGKEADQPDWKEKAAEEIYLIIADHTVNDKSKTAEIIYWIDNNKDLIK